MPAIDRLVSFQPRSHGPTYKSMPGAVWTGRWCLYSRGKVLLIYIYICKSSQLEAKKENEAVLLIWVVLNSCFCGLSLWLFPTPFETLNCKVHKLFRTYEFPTTWYYIYILFWRLSFTFCECRNTLERANVPYPPLHPSLLNRMTGFCAGTFSPIQTGKYGKFQVNLWAV